MPPLPMGNPDRRLPCRRLPHRHFLKGSLKAFPSGIPMGISFRNSSGPGLGRAGRPAAPPDRYRTLRVLVPTLTAMGFANNDLQAFP